DVVSTHRTPRRGRSIRTAARDRLRYRTAVSPPRPMTPPDTEVIAEATQDVTARIRAQARVLGFDVVGVARADESLGVDHERFRPFVARGMHGAMGYLAENVEARRRLDTSDILEGARSVVCVGRRYARPREVEEQD